MENIMILMSTYNGEAYLNEQIESLVKQIDVNVQILVRDDGSTDNTHVILNKWENNGFLKWYKGRNKGPALSFFDLVSKAPSANYYAFCDQDDIWYSNKLVSATSKLNKIAKRPALYFSRARYVKSNMEFIGLSEENPSCDLGGALIGSHSLGCTMVMNKQLMQLLKMYTPKNVLHDAWLIRLCLAIDGELVYDENPYINYRQHSNNVVGFDKSRIKRAIRLIKYARKNKNHKSEIAKELLVNYSEYISKNEKEILKQVSYYNESLIAKMRLIRNKNIRRKSKKENMLFHLSIILGVY